MPIKLFFSYGHDQNTPVVLRLKQDLEALGYSVWIDRSEIKTGDDWRRTIMDGIARADWTLGFLSEHSVRNPGVCLDELPIALHAKGRAIATILLEAEASASVPVSVSHLQWLDMHESAERQRTEAEDWNRWYHAKLAELRAVLESPRTKHFAGEIAALQQWLKLTIQASEIGRFIDGFVGRTWLLDRLQEWRKTRLDSRMFWITGAPGAQSDADGWASNLLLSSSHRIYEPERNRSFLRGSVTSLFREFGSMRGLEGWVEYWPGVL